MTLPNARHLAHLKKKKRQISAFKSSLRVESKDLFAPHAEKQFSLNWHRHGRLASLKITDVISKLQISWMSKVFSLCVASCHPPKQSRVPVQESYFHITLNQIWHEAKASLAKTTAFWNKLHLNQTWKMSHMLSRWREITSVSLPCLHLSI